MLNRDLSNSGACRWCSFISLSGGLYCPVRCRGIRAYDQNDYVEAIRLWSTALSLNEGNAAVILCNRSSAYAQQGLWVEALVDARQVTSDFVFGLAL